MDIDESETTTPLWGIMVKPTGRDKWEFWWTGSQLMFANEDAARLALEETKKRLPDLHNEFRNCFQMFDKVRLVCFHIPTTVLEEYE